MKRRKTEDMTTSPFSSNSLLKVNQLNYDRDSGFMTENESDIEVHSSNSPAPALIFSDDDNEQITRPMFAESPQQQQQRKQFNTAFSSPTYYTSLADQAVNSLRSILNNQDWKKVLKHKSGTTIYMSENNQSKSEKTAIFKGEAIIEGFTPQSIFYVIGMRKLWDEQFDEGKLIENLNDTTSITYESYKSSGTSKAYDLSLVEKIECLANGEIVFACTSVDSPSVPKIPGKNRNQVKLQGWILKPIRTSPASTKVVYITQESVKGWIPGLTKKSLARKPLIIATIDDYLKQKAAARNKSQSHHSTALIISPPIPSKTPVSSTTNSFIQPNSLAPQSIIEPSNSPRSTIQTLSIHSIHSNNSINANIISSTTTNNTTTNNNNSNNNNSNENIPLISHPPPRKSSLLPNPPTFPKKRITFADQVTTSNTNTLSVLSNTTYSTSSRSSSPFDDKLMTISEVPDNSITLQPLPPIPQIHREMSGITKTAIAGSKLYPSSRHRTVRKETMDRFHQLVECKDGWTEASQRNNVKVYLMPVQDSPLPIVRGEITILGTWTPEQVCSVIQCFGARKIWDEQFEQGHVVERFSQKEYLIYTEMKSLFPIQSRDFCALTTIESNMSTGGIYIVSSSVVDTLVPESEKHTRGDILVNGFALEPVKSKQGRLIGVKVIFINHLNMGGVTPLPSSITRLLTTEVPYCLDRIESFLDQKGCPPYIRRVAGKVTLEHFEDTIYRMEFIAKHAPSRQYRKNRTSSISNMWCTDLRIHSSMYKNGFEITTEPKEDVRIEIKPDGSGLRIFTERSEMDGKTIRLLIEPIHELSPGVKPQFIWNNTPLILENVARAYKNKNIAEKPDKLNRSIAKQVSVDDHMDMKEEQQYETGKETIFTERRNSHVVVISDELSFTGQQFSFIILLMAVCYYLGKFSCRCTI